MIPYPRLVRALRPQSNVRSLTKTPNILGTRKARHRPLPGIGFRPAVSAQATVMLTNSQLVGGARLSQTLRD